MGVRVGEEIDPAYELHREEDVAGVDGDELVKPNQVHVMKVRQRAKLLLEAIESGGVEARQCLERQRLRALTVERFVDDAHSALADPSHDPVASGPLPVRRRGRISPQPSD